MGLDEVLKLKKRFEAECEKFLEKILPIQRELCDTCISKDLCPIRPIMVNITIKDVAPELIVERTIMAAMKMWEEILRFEQQHLGR